MKLGVGTEVTIGCTIYRSRGRVPRLGERRGDQRRVGEEGRLGGEGRVGEEGWGGVAG